jgi:tRNA-binding protein
MTEEKEIVSKEETFDKLDIRLGRVISVEEEPSAPKKAYKMKAEAKIGGKLF